MKLFTVKDIEQDNISFVDSCENCKFIDDTAAGFYCNLYHRWVKDIKIKLTDCVYY